jgi:3-oxoacyl-[acyl-carrier-protein] synthase II
MPNAAAGLLSMRLGWTGPNITVSTACATGSHALGEGMRLIRDGTADVVLAGASEASITPVVVTEFANLQALSTRNDEPSCASRPFDARRDGFVIGEGAAFCVLENVGLARERGARIHALLAGYGRNADAYHLAMPAPDGAGAVACMQMALHDAAIDSEAVVHVNTHGTSTDLNDRAEARALHKVFSGDPPPVTANKGVLGHLVTAAGAAEAVAVCLSLTHGLIPPVANYVYPDPEIDLNVVAGGTRPFRPGPVVSNSFGFGGQNASLVIVPGTDP